MTTYKCKQTGKWMARFYYTTHYGQRKQKKKRGFDLKRDPEEYETDFLSRLKGQPFIPFSAFCDEYLKDSEKRTKRTTHAAKVSAVEKHFKPYFKDKPLNEITPSDIRGWQNNQIAIKAAPSSIAIRSGVLSSIFSHAVKFHNLKQNPVLITGGAGSLKKKRINFWTLDQFNRFIEVVDGVFYKAVFTTFFYTGLRFGELMGLTLNSFDFESFSRTRVGDPMCLLELFYRVPFFPHTRGVQFLNSIPLIT